jgi:hypothetical protein
MNGTKPEKVMFFICRNCYLVSLLSIKKLNLIKFSGSAPSSASTGPGEPMQRQKAIRSGALTVLFGFALAALVAAFGIPFLDASGSKLEAPPAETKYQKKPLNNKNADIFQKVADQALLAMTKRAAELHIQGVAVVAFIEGDSVKAWMSKMVVIGSMTKAPAQNEPGANLLAIAYAKASEMAETLKDSGSGGRPPMTGEFGWQGGVIAKGRTGYLIASFSGGPSEDDVKVSRTGVDILASKL